MDRAGIEHTSARAPGSSPADAQPLGICLVNVPAGVAAGHVQPLGGNAQLEWWALFVSHEQYDSCAERDPLRFAEPVRFARINREFNHVFDQPRPRDPGDVHQGAIAER